MSASLPPWFRPGMVYSVRTPADMEVLQRAYAQQDAASQLEITSMIARLRAEAASIRRTEEEYRVRKSSKYKLARVADKHSHATWNFFMKKISRLRVRMYLFGTYILAGSAVALGLSALCAAWRFFFWSIIQ